MGVGVTGKVVPAIEAKGGAGAAAKRVKRVEQGGRCA